MSYSFSYLLSPPPVCLPNLSQTASPPPALLSLAASGHLRHRGPRSLRCSEFESSGPPCRRAQFWVEHQLLLLGESSSAAATSPLLFWSSGRRSKCNRRRPKSIA
ncbi:unnamed protein product [Urochloa humidicola]